MSATRIVFINSYLYNFSLDIFVGQLMLILYDTQIILPMINVKVRSPEFLKVPSLIHFDKVMMVRNTSIPQKKEKLLKASLNIESEHLEYHIIFDLINPYVIINDTYFDKIHMTVQSKRQTFESLFFHLQLEKCTFMNSFHVGNGGVVTIASEILNSEVNVLDCIFSNNSALKGSGNLHGRGGGLYVEAKSLKLLLEGCIFKGNKAYDAGLALYSTGGTEVSVTNCTFQYVTVPNAPMLQSMVFVSGKLIFFHGLFLVLNPRPESYVGAIDVFYAREGISLNIETHCPKWYNHLIEYTSISTDSKAISDVKYKCIPCSDYYYSTSIEKNTLYYDGKGNNTLTKSLKGEGATGSCVKCPYGALCTGNNVIPRPNYWGYWYRGKLQFRQCPAGYCCSGRDSNMCIEYDYCPRNRTGILCGACQEGFSISILTGKCILHSLCGRDQWFWFIVVLAAMAYVWWYTLKDDIFAIVYLVIFCKHLQSGSCSNDKDIFRFRFRF